MISVVYAGEEGVDTESVCISGMRIHTIEMFDKIERSMPLNPSDSKHQRIEILDEIRGASLFFMILYHGCYVLGWLFHIEWAHEVFLLFRPLEPCGAGLFIFVCGMSCRLSRSNLRRGLQLLVVAAGISLTLWFLMRSQMIWFGILHFLAAAVLIFALLKPVLKKVPPVYGFIFCFVFFWLTWNVPAQNGGFFGIKGWLELPVPEILSSNRYLFPLGFGWGIGADYRPILPWIFCFLAGTFVGYHLFSKKLPVWVYRKHAPFLSFMGRNTLILYILHQPVIYLTCWFFLKLANRV